MKKILMARGADKVVSTCVKVKPGEKVLIITEDVYKRQPHNLRLPPHWTYSPGRPPQV